MSQAAEEHKLFSTATHIFEEKTGSMNSTGKILTLLILLLLGTFSTHAQEENKICVKSTAGLPKAKGVTLNLPYPCAFDEYDVQRPNTVFTVALGDADLSVSISAIITRMEYPSRDLADAHQRLKSDIFDDKTLPVKVLAERNLYIHGLPCKEWILLFTVNMPDKVEYQKKLTYVFMLNWNMIMINYQVFGINKNEVNNTFQDYLKLYRKLAQNIMITKY